MIVASMPLDPQWKAALNIEHRRPPDLFESSDEVRDTLYAPAVRTGLDELGLAAVFCVNRVPTIAFRRSHDYAPTDVQKIYGALWNQGLATVFVDITDDTVRVFSLARAFAGTDVRQLEDNCLLEALDHTTSALQENLPEIVTGVETGRIWHDNPKYFRPDERIDAVLLNNLSVAHRELTKSHLPPEQAQAALIQTMFISYLEDRAIIDSDYVNRATLNRYNKWADILAARDTQATKLLFAALRNSFNGDLFITPCSFTEDEQNQPLSSKHLHILERFRVGKEAMSSDGPSQLRFWGYNFRYIPIELISEVYDNFLRRDENLKKISSAYYTPMFLADTVLSSTWELLDESHKLQGHFFDPSCGSGIFLVKIFQRLCQHWRDSRLINEPIPWDVLLSFIRRIHGLDIASSAVRIAAFSLYLALLEQITSADVRRLLDTGHHLPSLWKQTLVSRDFFSDPIKKRTCDVIISNPPWGKAHLGQKEVRRWSKNSGYPVPGNELAWAFAWKAMNHLNEGGLATFLLPAMTFLHNQTGTCIKARNRLFDETRVELVADLSDLRRQLFAGAFHPATMMILRKPSKSTVLPYSFTYLAPKADPNLAVKRFVSLTPRDRVRLRSSDIMKNSRIFLENLWLQPTESSLFRYLSGLPDLGNFMDRQFGDCRTTQWRVGRGFEVWNEGRSGKARESPIIVNIPHIPTRKLTSLRVSVTDLDPWGSSKVRRLGLESGFHNSRILVKTGIATSKGRFAAAYVEESLSFNNSIIVISVPTEQSDTAKFITAYLSSRLAIWYALHGTVALGAGRPRMTQQGLLQLPLPCPEDLADRNRAREARARLIQEIDSVIPSSYDPRATLRTLDDSFARIDRLTYDYFGLSEDEIALVDETVEYILPAIHPPPTTFPKLWEGVLCEERKTYADTVRNRIAGWLIDSQPPSVRLIAHNEDFAIVELSIEQTRAPNEYREEGSTRFAAALKDLATHLGQPVSGNFLLTPDVRIFLGQKLYLIKPLQRRFWLRSAALADADNIAMDLEELWRKNRKNGSPA